MVVKLVIVRGMLRFVRVRPPKEVKVWKCEVKYSFHVANNLSLLRTRRSADSLIFNSTLTNIYHWQQTRHFNGALFTWSTNPIQQTFYIDPLRIGQLDCWNSFKTLCYLLCEKHISRRTLKNIDEILLLVVAAKMVGDSETFSFTRTVYEAKPHNENKLVDQFTKTRRLVDTPISDQAAIVGATKANIMNSLSRCALTMRKCGTKTFHSRFFPQTIS